VDAARDQRLGRSWRRSRPARRRLLAGPGADWDRACAVVRRVETFRRRLGELGSVALFHIAGITPEATRFEDLVPTGRSLRSHKIGEAEVRGFQARYTKDIEAIDVVVFSAPQLSLIEMRALADLLGSRRVSIPLLAVTSPQIKADADRMGFTARIEAAGGTVLSGMCFYQSYAREIAEANGWRRLATNSAKLVNILGGYGYQPVLLSTERCVAAACAGGKLG